MLIPAAISLLAFTADPPVITVDRDNIEITQSCHIRIKQRTGPTSPIVDADNNGVIHITASDITVEFSHDDDSPALYGASESQTPDAFTGMGIVITGRNVTLANARVAGFKVGIHARNADGLTIHDCEVSGNFHQRLKSTPQAEDASDWLWPHANDNDEWVTNYGAGVCVEESDNVTIHNIRARRTQNGIVLDRVNDSKVYDCDCSFLSGWGLAMWRSSRNVISRNAFDFCVRGYSHGVYNRGQDSAGILMFEQCCENIIAENSATHCGDGFFGFAGKEALGEVNPRDDLEWYKRRGNNDNILWKNDFSSAPAHGIEMTFSFGNQIIENTLIGNAICGVWGGYSRETMIADNVIQANGEMAYGLERGGVNIEHGRKNVIARNALRSNRCAIHLWSDDDGALKETPWARANSAGSADELIIRNVFEQNEVDVELCETTHTQFWANRNLIRARVKMDEQSAKTVELPDGSTGDIAIRATRAPLAKAQARGKLAPLGARKHLAGREHIIMTEWGPWDHESPLLQFMEHFDTADVYRLRGATVMPTADQIRLEGDATAMVERDMIAILPKQKNTVTPYRVAFKVDGHTLGAGGVLAGDKWQVMTFPSAVDPRENVEQWREAGVANAKRPPVDNLDLRFGAGGMAEALDLAPMDFPHDHFGVIATHTLTFPTGRWRITTTSDDGIRVWLNDQLVIDDWTWHAPKKHTYDFETADAKEMNMRVEYFELDGYATLQLEISSGG